MEFDLRKNKKTECAWCAECVYMYFILYTKGVLDAHVSFYFIFENL